MMSFTVLFEFLLGEGLKLEIPRDGLPRTTSTTLGLKPTIRTAYNTGHDVVTLTEPGFHYFITSNQGQCVLGQKLEVLVIHDLSSPVPPPTPPSKILPVGNTYKVGDSKGWTVYDSDFYSKWSEEKQFHVGDSLIFESPMKSTTSMRSTEI
ncbi:hypothetical protein Bca52824_080148 [Brassica carinata]|uniref:Phytocyanin domain-containing protein n=1 Tax=Brassica carinata TaxID=52824 RepID=A0A8X7PYT1_BRACI|nr:hypothetical protein Bca52824_080148 [Brassica carinata]